MPQLSERKKEIRNSITSSSQPHQKKVTDRQFVLCIHCPTWLCKILQVK